MQRRFFIRTAGLATASVLLLGPVASARTISIKPAPTIDPAQYGVWDIQKVVLNFAASTPTITYPSMALQGDLGTLPVIQWQVLVNDASAFLEAGRYLMLGHFGTIYAQGGTLSFVYSGAQHNITLVVPEAPTAAAAD